MGKRITVLGAGAWGTAMASVLADNGNDVTLWCFETSVVDDIVAYRLNKQYLPGIELDDKIVPTESLQEAVEKADIIFVAIPIAFLREVFVLARSYVHKGQTWVLLSKGIENKTMFFPSQVLQDVFDSDGLREAVLSGPNFARQLAVKKQTASVVAARDSVVREEIKRFCANDYFKILINEDNKDLASDIYGLQVCGAIKNVSTLFLGILEGSGYVENSRAYFIKLCLDETARLVELCGGVAETAYGIAGLGDTVLGLMGERNRNYSVGVLFGKGNSLNEVAEVYDVLPEGINTCKSVYQMIEKHKYDLPVCLATYQIIFEGKPINDVVNSLWKAF